MDDDYGIGVVTELEFDQAVTRTRIALRSEGFGILSEMRVPSDLGGEGRRHLFLSLWQRLIGTDHLGTPGTDVGDHFACNVVVYQEGGKTIVAGLDPTEGMEGWEAPLGKEAKRALERALQGVLSG